MRKFITILFLIFSFFGFSQNQTGFIPPLPNYNSLGSPTTLTEIKGVLNPRFGIILSRWADTTAANTNAYIKSYPGMQIVIGDTVYIRNSTATAWVIASGGSGGSGGSGLFPTTGTGTATGAVIGSLSGNTLSITQGANSFLSFDPTAGSETSLFRAYNTTGSDNSAFLSATTTNTDAQYSLSAVFNGGAKSANVSAVSNTTTSLLSYTADTHTFNGNVGIGAAPTTLFQVQSGGEDFLSIDVTTNSEHVKMLAINTTGDGNAGGATGFTTNLEANGYVEASFNDGDKLAIIRAYANVTESYLQYDAELHRFNGVVRIQNLSGNGTGYAAIDNLGNLSWSAGPNIIVQNAGSGIGTWYTSGDTLYMKKIKAATITATTDTDSSLLLNVTNADRGDITVTSTGTVWTIDNGVVTIAKLAATGTPSASTYLRGDNTWATIAGGGDVVKVGTPVNNYLGVWTGDGTIEGDVDLQFDGTALSIGGTAVASALLDMTSTTKGLLVPRMTTTQRNNIGSPALSLIVFDTDLNSHYYYNGSAWGTFGGANVNLSNLTSVAINTTLMSDADGTDDLGTTSSYWKDVYSYTHLFKGLSTGVVTFKPAAAAGTWTFTLPPDDGTVDYLLRTDGNGVTTWVAAGAGNVIKVATPLDNQVGVWTGDGTIEGDADLIFNGTQLGIKGTPAFVLDVWGSASDLIVMGGELAATTRTNSTTKYGAYAIPHYTLAEEPFVLIRGSSGSGSNIVVIGNGIASAGNSATSVETYTAGNGTTTAGTRRINLTNTEITFNDGLFNHNFIVSGDVTANLLVVDANGLTNGAVGIGTAAPTSILHVAGSFAVPYTATATGITADATHHTIDVTATGQTITLPTAVGCTGRIYTIKLTASGSCTVATTSSQNIDASTTYSLSAQYKYVSVQSTNAHWIIIANNDLSWIVIIVLIPTLLIRKKDWWAEEHKHAA